VTSASSLWIGIMALALVAFLATLRKRLRRRRQWDQEEMNLLKQSLRKIP
jgi:hypothetical protein